MLETGNWVFPYVLRKPPLYYWISGLIAQLRYGTVDALSLRLPSALLAGLGVVVVFWFGRQAATQAGGALAGLILLTSFLYVQQGHNSRTDMALCFFVTCCLLLFFAAYTRPLQSGKKERWTSYGFAGSLALALLSKGPLGVILVLLPIAGFLLWRRDWGGTKSLLRIGSVLTLSVLGGGWYIYAFWAGGEDFWRTQIMEENIARFVGQIDVMSPLYYVVPLIRMSAPWNLLLPVALWRAFKENQAGPLFLALWWTTTMLFFELSAYKRARYLLPVQPASALLVGWWLATQLPSAATVVQRWKWWRSGVLLLSAAASLVVVIGVLVLWGTQRAEPFSCSAMLSLIVQEPHEQVVQYCEWLASHVWLGLAWWVLVALCLAFLLYSLARIHLEHALAALIVALLLVYTVLYPSWLTVTSWAASPQQFVSSTVEKLGPSGQVAFISPCAEKGFPVLFSLQGRVHLKEVPWPWGSPQPPLTTGYYLVTEERRAELTSQGNSTWSEVLRDTSPAGWPLVLFFYRANSDF
jgi:hypothetical protein